MILRMCLVYSHQENKRMISSGGKECSNKTGLLSPIQLIGNLKDKF